MRTSSITSAMVAAFILLPAAAAAQSSTPRGSEGFSARGFVQNSPGLERATERLGPPRIYNDVPIRVQAVPQRMVAPFDRRPQADRPEQTVRRQQCAMPAPRPKASSYCARPCWDDSSGPEGICLAWKLLH